MGDIPVGWIARGIPLLAVSRILIRIEATFQN